MTPSQIPIRNVYFLLCYAWNRLAEGEVVDVSGIESAELVDLFASVLVSGVRHVQRRGLQRGYDEATEELRSIRGRIEIASSARRFLPVHGRAICTYDELTPNTPANQIIRETLRRLALVESVDPDLKHLVNGSYQSLNGIERTRLSRLAFRQIQLHGNARFYRFLLSICELVAGSLLVDERSGSYRFRDFRREPKQMARLFESFILNFLRVRRADLDVRKEKISWEVDHAIEESREFLPSMEMDISIRGGGRTLIIEAKYYQQALASYFDSKKIRSGHLYQLFSYLKNMEARGGPDATAEGMILYPTVDEDLALEYQIQGHRIRVCTLDLSQEWPGIEEKLMELVADAGL
ncbi:MAG: 5-methylcytosine-specific restriction endonuclease system specificity protein McrC [bacterium]|nr:5-methylcytosine-specific restriction endonuclease system specificity protein McrC [bacterium]